MRRPLYFQDLPIILDLCPKYANVMEPNILSTLYSAVVERETRWGTLDSQGRWIIGDSGHGHFLPQIDDRYHAEWLKAVGPRPSAEQMHAKGLEILVGCLSYFKGRGFSDWVRRGVCAYNAGIDNVVTARRPDLVTTGHDYGADVTGIAFTLLSGTDGWEP